MKSANILNRKNSLMLTAFFSGIALSFTACDRSSPEPDPGPGPGTITPNTIEWCGHIDEPTVWSNHTDGVDYIITCQVDFRDNAELIIEPGTEIVFENNTGIYVGNGGAIIAKGTASLPIRFRGKNDELGSWKAIGITSDNPRNEFDHCIFENGGAGTFTGWAGVQPANLMIDRNTRVSVSNCTFSKSANYGVFAGGYAYEGVNPLTKFENNTFTNNKENPISINPGTIHSVSGTDHTYTGNGKQSIEVRKGLINENTVWKNTNIPYHIKDDIEHSEGNLDVEAGVTMQFDPQTAFRANPSNPGYIKFNGTESNPIRLQCADNEAYWDGLMMETRHPASVLNYVVVDRAGGTHRNGTSEAAGVTAGNFANTDFKLMMNNCTISNSAGYGISGYTGVFPTLSSITYISNALGDSYID